MLLLLGLVVALGQGPLQDYVDSVTQSGRHFFDRDVEMFVRHGIPGGLVIVTLVAGCMLLVAARRREGAWHFLRGCVGSLLALVGALLGMIEGREGLRILFGQADLSVLLEQGDGVWGPVLSSAILLALGALLFLWPSKLQRSRPIVV
jgi:hypothetical protein